MLRRTFLHHSLLASLAAIPGIAQEKRPARILLRNGWQSINIGDIAHPLGALELIEKYQVNAEVYLWKSNVENGARELLLRRFPKLIILETAEDIKKAFETCDFFLHGSSSGFSVKNVIQWRDATKKPYGVFGISLLEPTPEAIEVVNGADFVYFRDSKTLQGAIDHGAKCPIMAYGPDTAFGIRTLRNEEKAEAFLKENGLEAGKFMVCIPRYRFTPFWRVKDNYAFDNKKHERNLETQDSDHKPHRQAITRLVRELGMKVLVTCEDQTQIALGKEQIYDKLPDDVKSKVVWRDRYWLTDEALSVYVRSAGLFGNEMHSPIMSISNGIPAVVCRFDEQTPKGYMWEDIGLGEWLFDLDKADQVARIPQTVIDIAKNPEAAKNKVLAAQKIVIARQDEMLANLKNSLHKATS